MFDRVLFRRIQEHIGHHVVCVRYGDSRDPDCVTVECQDCGAVIVDVSSEEDPGLEYSEIS